MAFRLGHPLLVGKPKAKAACLVALCALVVLLADHVATLSIGFEPAFLLIGAWAAWFVGTRFAVILGLCIAGIQVLNGQILGLRSTHLVEIFELVFQVGSAFVVILMLGMAREALENEWRFARIDPLTRALNRSAFFEILATNNTRRGPAVLIFMDLDGMKRINDNLGHEKGDETLADFSQRVREKIRKGDLFARIGGDEFVIFMYVQDLSAARMVADRLNGYLNNDPDPKVGTPTCSMGAILLPDGSTDIDDELRQADLLMYQAKKSGSGIQIAIAEKQNLDKAVHAFPAYDLSNVHLTVVRSGNREGPNSPGEDALDGIEVA